MKPFLTARWEDLVLLNYACPEALLAPHVPQGTTLDPWQGKHFVSLVGFRFRETRVRGVPIPGHRNFDEVNLRFYVRREVDGEVRRGVVFIKELVPRRAIAAVARLVYNEPYQAVPMQHDVDLDTEDGGHATYQWQHRGNPYRLHATATGPAQPLAPGSEAEFITEHYWGYNRQRSGATMEYRVDHPRWDVWEASNATFNGPAAALYGDPWDEVLGARPQSAFLARGSPIKVFAGRAIADST